MGTSRLAWSVVAVVGCAQNTAVLAYEDATLPDRRDVHTVIAQDTPPTDVLACGGTIRSLSQTTAEVILVVDRSGSMLEPGLDRVPKWDELRRTFAYVLPREDAHIAFGLVTFPLPGDPTMVASACHVGAAVDVMPAFHTSAIVLSALDRYGPSGGTPTYGALQLAAQYFASEPDPTMRRFLVLTTDGGPNCNRALDANTCRCSAPPPACSLSLSPDASYNCLDDGRVVAALRVLAGDGIHTFVVGLPGTESFTDVLDAMAVAGGEARAASPHYFVASSYVDLVAAMNTITTTLSDCTFQLDMPPPDPTMVDVRLAGMRLPYDPSHRNGWDWSDASMHTTIAFYGATCDQVKAATGGEQLVAAFDCPPLPAPP